MEVFPRWQCLTFEVSIALRKDLTLCVLYPIFNFASCGRLKSFSLLLRNVCGVNTSRFLQRALENPMWKQPIQEEMRASY